jgi:hypothetical protein
LKKVKKKSVKNAQKQVQIALSSICCLSASTFSFWLETITRNEEIERERGRERERGIGRARKFR